ncbi:hypothetical protein M9434_005974 [Picochlorum sp. BPE23]|nr:hypothetical protein M9434_005974 [Picochlorum sp. BPE23]KAI8103720.1 hypothetical protein M9435_005054 [Picochlorum sp. BPE23]WPT16528.1 hypothetical protein PSENEW3_00004536 [Picochlorum sp. SENEW3]|eukprot:jgi/Picre1/30233/NNA_005601.t1
MGTDERAEDKRAENGALLLENEDEFEEFEVDEWTSSQQEVDEELWEQDWDDDVGAIDDAFSRRLKAELNGMQTS